MFSRAGTNGVFCDSVQSGGSRRAERSMASRRVFTVTSQRGQTSLDVVTGKSTGNDGYNNHGDMYI